MNLFINIHEMERDIDMQLSIATIDTYKEVEVTDPEGVQHICILYVLDNGLRFLEEFSSSEAREEKMSELDEYLA